MRPQRKDSSQVEGQVSKSSNFSERGSKSTKSVLVVPKSNNASVTHDGNNKGKSTAIIGSKASSSQRYYKCHSPSHLAYECPAINLYVREGELVENDHCEELIHIAEEGSSEKDGISLNNDNGNCNVIRSLVTQLRKEDD